MSGVGGISGESFVPQQPAEKQGLAQAKLKQMAELTETLRATDPTNEDLQMAARGLQHALKSGDPDAIIEEFGTLSAAVGQSQSPEAQGTFDTLHAAFAEASN